MGLGDKTALLKTFQNDEFPIQNYTFIAPFYGHVYPGRFQAGGICPDDTVKYSNEVITDTAALDNAKKQIREAFPEHEFSPKYLVVATWNDVRYDENDELVSKHKLQCTYIDLVPELSSGRARLYDQIYL